MKFFIAILSLLSMISTATAASLAASGPAQASQEQTTAARPSTMTIYVYPPRHEIDWSSPKNSLLSFLGEYAEAYGVKNSDIKVRSDFGEADTISSNYKSTMGHSIAHIQCQLPTSEESKIFDIWVSFSGQDSKGIDKKNTFERKLGMGVLFFNYPDGHLIVGEENWKRLVHYNGETAENENSEQEKRAPRFMKFPILPDSCLRLKKMVDFFKSFHFPEGTDGIHLERQDPESLLYFTNVIDPYVSYHNRVETGHGLVGGGCAPFAAALVKESGHYDDFFSQIWRRELVVSKRLIGGEIDHVTGQSIEVKIQELLFGDLGDHWQFDGYEDRRMKIYDPLLIWKFIGKVQSCHQQKKCDSDVAAWLQNSNFQVGPALPQYFEDSYRKQQRYGRDGQTRWVQYRKQVELHGIVIQPKSE